MLQPALDQKTIENFFDPLDRQSRYSSYKNVKRNKKAKQHMRSSQENNKRIVYNLKTINPITNTQKEVYRSYYNDKFPVLYGTAGTGKTFIALYLAMKDVLDPDTPYNKLIIIRSCVPTRNTGFLPGSQKEKEAIYETPYIGIFSELFGKSDAYEHFKKNGKVEFISTSYLRGTTFRDSIIVFDEFQNTTFHEFSSVMTRLGENTRPIVCGDIRQNDLSSSREELDAIRSIRVLNKMPSVSLVEFKPDDIVRSGLVKEFILATEKIVN